jgi:alkanesulfonate monooxygenase SsuD/methylene tetrahydromethanopterin reductase-like flavin-dependent oxidoreductase (luciferase family)
MLLRRLLDGERVDHDGATYTMRDALCEPRPVQAHLPILIGGGGRKKTLRTVAQRADAWNNSGPLDEIRDAVETLERHCADVGRDIATIERTASFHIIVRDDADVARRRTEELLGYNGVPMDGFGSSVAGSPEQVADVLRPYRDLGFRTFIVRMPAPYDRETIERMPEVGALLDA